MSTTVVIGEFGWPIVYLEYFGPLHYVAFPFTDVEVTDWLPVALGLDLLLATAMVCCTFLVMRRVCSHWPRFQLTAYFELSLMAGVLLTLLLFEGKIYSMLSYDVGYTTYFGSRFPLTEWPLHFGVALTIDELFILYFVAIPRCILSRLRSRGILKRATP